MNMYVNDTFVIAPWDQTNQLLAHLYSRQPSVRFTTEVEHSNTIGFLNSLVHRESDGSVTTTVYRKPTHTDQYLAYDSHHPCVGTVFQSSTTLRNQLVRPNDPVPPERRGGDV